MEQCDNVMNTERPFFDHKPLIMKYWSPNVVYNNEEVCSITIWVNIHVDVKYCGFGVLEKVVKPIGCLLTLDQDTNNRDKLNYARCLIVVKVMQDLPSSISFINEKGILVEAKVVF
ncbi:Agmatine deiminase [Bienertia sinuspersici]